MELFVCSSGSTHISLGGTFGSNGVLISNGFLDNGPIPLGPIMPTSITRDVHDSMLFRIAMFAEVLLFGPKTNNTLYKILHRR